MSQGYMLTVLEMIQTMGMTVQLKLFLDADMLSPSCRMCWSSAVSGFSFQR